MVQFKVKTVMTILERPSLCLEVVPYYLSVRRELIYLDKTVDLYPHMNHKMVYG